MTGQRTFYIVAWALVLSAAWVLILSAAWLRLSGLALAMMLAHR